MSIASRIQEIETHIGDVYNTIDYSYDTTGVNKNIINIPKYLKKGYIDIINNGTDTLYSNFPKVSGIGSNLSLTPTYEAPMKLNEIQGDTLQNGSPTPSSPVPIQSVTGLQNVEVCGKNLFDIDTTTNISGGTKTNNIITSSSYSSGSWVGMTINFSPISITEEFTISMDLRLTSGSTGTFNKINDGVTNFTEISKPTISENWQRYVCKYTPSSGYSINKFYIQMLSINGQFECRNIQLEQGSTATSYEPYKGNTYEVNLGKNLLNIPDGTYSNNGITAVVSNGEITLNGTASGTSFITITLPKEIVVENQTLTISNNNQKNINDTLTEMRLVTTVGNYIPCSFNQINNSTTRTNLTDTYNRLQIRITSGITFNNFVIYPQLEKGSQATSYSPYFTPIELNKIGDYKDSIKKSSGKNLLDVSKCINGYINSNGEIVTSDQSNLLTDYIKVQSGNNYTISLNTQFSNIGYALFDSNKTYISRQNNNNKTTITITIPNNVEYLRIWFNYNGTTTLTPINILTYQPMINEGSTATTYEPYGKVWYIEKNIGKVVLNGSEKWFDWSNNRMVLATLTDYKKVDSSTTSLLMSNYYKAVSRANSQTNNSMCFYSSSDDSFGIIVCDGTNNTSTLLKAWLSTHNTEVLYVLNTPTYTEITNTELIEDLETLYTAKSQEGTTNISITSEDLEMILNISALEGDE